MRALILVDIQNDFCEGGALAVPNGARVVPVANELARRFELVAATQDWHPVNHKSFAANRGARPFELGELGGQPQVLWPVHCVEHTHGAELHRDLDRSRIARVFRKGSDPDVDSYSGFFDNHGRRSTGLVEWLRERDVDELAVCGLATDYCVKATVLDALCLGFRVELMVDACRGLTSAGVIESIDAMERAGARISGLRGVLEGGTP